MKVLMTLVFVSVFAFLTTLWPRLSKIQKKTKLSLPSVISLPIDHPSQEDIRLLPSDNSFSLIWTENNSQKLVSAAAHSSWSPKGVWPKKNMGTDFIEDSTGVLWGFELSKQDLGLQTWSQKKKQWLKWPLDHTSTPWIERRNAYHLVPYTQDAILLWDKALNQKETSFYLSTLKSKKTIEIPGLYSPGCIPTVSVWKTSIYSFISCKNKPTTVHAYDSSTGQFIQYAWDHLEESIEPHSFATKHIDQDVLVLAWTDYQKKSKEPFISIAVKKKNQNIKLLSSFRGVNGIHGLPQLAKIDQEHLLIFWTGHDENKKQRMWARTFSTKHGRLGQIYELGSINFKQGHPQIKRWQNNIFLTWNSVKRGLVVLRRFPLNFFDTPEDKTLIHKRGLSYTNIEKKDHQGMIRSVVGGTKRLVVFWASWCEPCMRELPILNKLHQSKAIEVLGINLDDWNREGLRHFKENNELLFPQIPSDDLPSFFEVDQLPTVIAIDAQGRELGRIVGQGNDNDILGLF